MRRFLLWALGALVVLGALGVVGVGWYYSSEILDVERPGDPQRDIEVLAVTEHTVTLPSLPDTTLPGTWGLDAPEAYARMGKPTRPVTAESVTRKLVPVDGTLRPGDLVDVDGDAYPEDPAAALDFDVSEITLTGPLGPQPAWLAKGRNQRRWAVLVHGRAAQRSECLRLLEILVTAHRFNVICPSYRNDPGAPADPDGIYRQGAQEWRDVEPALQYALDHGARQVVVGGFSLGGQITANLLRHSTLGDAVDAVIWDAPLLDWGPAIAAGAHDRGVPAWLVPIGMQASAWRAGVDYDDLNQIEHAEEFEVPILLIHGARDTTVAFRDAQRFATARPDLVTLERFGGAGHVRSWNTAPGRYSDVVGSFIEDDVF